MRRAGPRASPARLSFVGQQGPEDEVDDELRSGQQAGEHEEQTDHAGGESEAAGESGADSGDPAIVAGAGEAAGHGHSLLHISLSWLDGRGAWTGFPRSPGGDGPPRSRKGDPYPEATRC